MDLCELGKFSESCHLVSHIGSTVDILVLDSTFNGKSICFPSSIILNGRITLECLYAGGSILSNESLQVNRSIHSNNVIVFGDIVSQGQIQCSNIYCGGILQSNTSILSSGCIIAEEYIHVIDLICAGDSIQSSESIFAEDI